MTRLRQPHSPDEPPEHSPIDHHGYPQEFQFYDWEAVNLNTRNHKPDLSSDSDYFSTSTTYRAHDNYKGNYVFLVNSQRTNLFLIFNKSHKILEVI